MPGMPLDFISPLPKVGTSTLWIIRYGANWGIIQKRIYQKKI